MKLKVRAVIFDMDGTILNSVEPYYKVVVETFKRLGLPPAPREKVLEVMGQGRSPWESLVPEELEGREEVLEECRRLGEELIGELFPKELELIDGSREVLRGLKESGFLTGIATSSWGVISVQFLQRRGLLGYLDAIVTGREVAEGKPAPDLILECLKRMGASTQEAVYVGDSPVDIRAGKAAKVRTVGVLTGTSDYDTLLKEGPDLIIDHVRELVKVLKPFKEVRIRGVIYSDLGRAASFTQLDWVREEFKGKLGIDPYPGTLNLMVNEPGLLKELRKIRKSPGIETTPQEGFCTAKAFQVLIEGKVRGAIIIPLVPDYPLEKLEIIAPVKIKEALGVKDGQTINLTVYL